MASATTTGEAGPRTQAMGCSLARIQCGVPPTVVGGNYTIQGNEDAPAGGSCAPRSNSTSVYFDAPVDECNVSVAETSEKTVLTVVLIPNPGSLGADPRWPTVVCVCEVLTSGTVAGSIESGPDHGEDLVSHIVEPFLPRLVFFADANYTDAYSLGEPIPTTQDRIYVEVSSAGADDVVGVPDCVATATDSVDDAFAQAVFTNYCDVDIFGIVLEPGPTDGRTNAARWSMRKFKFAGFPRVYLTCQVARCSSPPCGTCESWRRLHEAPGTRQLSANTTGELVAESFELQPGRYRVLPADMPLVARTPVWGDPGAQHGVPAAGTLWSNITMYGFPNISDAVSFVHVFERSMRRWTALEVHVNHVSVVLGLGLVPEATIVDLNLVTGDIVGLGELRLLQIMDNTDFVTMLLRSLGHHRYEPGDVTIDLRYTRPALPRSPVPILPPSADASVHFPVVLTFFSTSAFLAALLVLASSLVVWRRLRKAEAAQSKLKQAANKDAQKLDLSIDQIMGRLQQVEDANQDMGESIKKINLRFDSKHPWSRNTPNKIRALGVASSSSPRPEPESSPRSVEMPSSSPRDTVMPASSPRSITPL